MKQPADSRKPLTSFGDIKCMTAWQALALTHCAPTSRVRQCQLFGAFQAQQMGHGGIMRMAEITGLDRKTIRKGLREITDYM